MGEKSRRSKSEVWKIVNEERKRKSRKVDETIKMREWKEYFMKVLGRVERRVRKGIKGERRNSDIEEEISREEVRAAIRKQKAGKASGIDEIPMEMWKYGGEEIEK